MVGSDAVLALDAAGTAGVPSILVVVAVVPAPRSSALWRYDIMCAALVRCNAQSFKT